MRLIINHRQKPATPIIAISRGLWLNPFKDESRTKLIPQNTAFVLADNTLLGHLGNISRRRFQPAFELAVLAYLPYHFYFFVQQIFKDVSNPVICHAVFICVCVQYPGPLQADVQGFIYTAIYS